MANDLQQQTGQDVDVRVHAPIAPLETGDHLDQKTFHERYEAMPDSVKAELIGGVVYMPAALRRRHGRSSSLLIHWLYAYEDATPGVEVYDNATTIMGEESEPQPDACLIIRPDCGGQMRFTDDDYLEGAPEFAAEVASSTEAYDLHSKKRDYELAGVKEYLVVALRQRKVFWFVNRNGQFVEQEVDASGHYRSSVFPGLWLDPNAIIELNSQKLLATLREGLATPEHTAFVKQLG
ncbi:MAG TPA: Uma2 family endonuclease [Pirellulaceae bacterium]|nr:Uma2 family endonuclease [Pirellulaceae bacterium]